MIQGNFARSTVADSRHVLPTYLLTLPTIVLRQWLVLYYHRHSSWAETLSTDTYTSDSFCVSASNLANRGFSHKGTRHESPLHAENATGRVRRRWKRGACSWGGRKTTLMRSLINRIKVWEPKMLPDLGCLAGTSTLKLCLPRSCAYLPRSCARNTPWRRYTNTNAPSIVRVPSRLSWLACCFVPWAGKYKPGVALPCTST